MFLLGFDLLACVTILFIFSFSFSYCTHAFDQCVIIFFNDVSLSPRFREAAPTGRFFSSFFFIPFHLSGLISKMGGVQLELRCVAFDKDSGLS